jgi:cation diffusion facilitator CzcD-associated flavoprotein CzcO
MGEVMGPMIDCVVAGGGPAGLAVSAALDDLHVDHVVLERERVGHSWRTQRWDSLRLNNPGWMNPMLGSQEPDTYLTPPKWSTGSAGSPRPGPSRSWSRWSG